MDIIDQHKKHYHKIIITVHIRGRGGFSKSVGYHQLLVCIGDSVGGGGGGSLATWRLGDKRGRDRDEYGRGGTAIY